MEESLVITKQPKRKRNSSNSAGNNFGQLATGDVNATYSSNGPLRQSEYKGYIKGRSENKNRQS